jgi:oxaloacetate decarboxylase beta subunit
MSFFDFISTLGIFSLTFNQSIMIVVGLLLLYLAISKKFEPLLLLPIGFGAILTNIPEIGLALSPIEKLIYLNNSDHIGTILEKFFSLNQDLVIALKDVSYTDLIAINNEAQNLGYKPGILVYIL